LAPHTEALRQWRSRLHRGEAGMAALCEALDWRLDLREMAYFSHWLTPVIRPKRFDTRFFVRLAPPAQEAMPDMGEALELLWLTPDEALDPQRALKLLNVTQRTLHDMRGFASARAAYEHALALRGVALHFPRPALGREGQRFIIEDHPAYAEVAHLDPDGRGDLRCELQPGEVTQLSPRLWRVAGRERNAYLVGDPQTDGWVSIGANANEAAQCQAIHTLGARPARELDAGVTDRVLRLGPGTTLRAQACGWLLEEDRILIGGLLQDSAMPLSGVDWLAPPYGFLVRCGAR
jgi:hypothetical protein